MGFFEVCESAFRELIMVFMVVTSACAWACACAVLGAVNKMVDLNCICGGECVCTGMCL